MDKDTYDMGESAATTETCCTEMLQQIPTSSLSASVSPKTRRPRLNSRMHKQRRLLHQAFRNDQIVLQHRTSPISPLRNLPSKNTHWPQNRPPS